ncbi:MAG: hypothetical protein FWD69_03910 [Polyangiaceae bacterium]|nr:hypothetical protein [Polyangiaceae bacterium]
MKSYLFVLPWLTVLGGCGHSPESKPAAPSVVNVVVDKPPATTAAHQEEVPSESWFTGSIDEKLPIRMVLFRTETKLAGKYVYEKNPLLIELEGTMKPGGDIELEERVKGKVTGHFHGHMDAHQFVGQWSGPSGKRTLPFQLDMARGRMVFLRERTIDEGDCHKANWYEVPAGLDVLAGLDASHAADLNQALNPGGYSENNKNDDDICTGHEGEGYFARSESTVSVNDSGVLSIIIHADWLVPGGAHEFSSHDYVNYWLDEERNFTLRDALTPAAEAILKKHAKEMIEKETTEDGTNSDAEEYISSALSLDNEEFVIESEGIRLFSANRVPYAFPTLMQEIVISFYELRGAIKNPGPLAKLAAPR